MDTIPHAQTDPDTDGRPSLMSARTEPRLYGSPFEQERTLRDNANRNLLVGIALGGAVAIGAMAYFANEQGSFAVAGQRVDQQVQATSAQARDVTAEVADSAGSSARTTGVAVDQSLSDVADQARGN